MYKLRSEKGQSIVIVAIVMVGLIALVGLALDGGNLFLQRRQVQNAVDASAMAGTRVLAQAICGEAGIDDAAIAQAVYGFAESNGIEDAEENVTATYVNFDLQNLGTVGDGSIPVGATGISIDVSAEEETFFIRVVGVDKFNVNAAAIAMTSPPAAGAPMTGVRPVAVPLDVLNYVGVGDELTFRFGKKCDVGDSCAISWTAHGGGTQSHRGWVSLGWAWNQSEDPSWDRTVIKNVSNKNVKVWMENGFHMHPLYADAVGGVYGDFVHASPGERQSAIAAAPIGDIIILPLFDYFTQYSDIPAPKGPPAAGVNDDYYHVVGFIGIRVTSILPTNEHAFAGTVENIILGAGQVSPAPGYGEPAACQTHMMTINLWD
jgi:hypothetical protein